MRYEARGVSSKDLNVKKRAHDVEFPMRLGVRPRYSEAIGFGWERSERRIVRLVAGAAAAAAGAAPGAGEGTGWCAL